MAHFAEIDSNNNVIRVLKISNEYDSEPNGQNYINNVMGLRGNWLKTSYNTKGAKHYTSNTITLTTYPTDSITYYDSSTRSMVTMSGVPVITTYTTDLSADGLSGFRYNYATIGGTYDPVRDAFIPAKYFPSWILNEQTCNWIPPSAYPTDGQKYKWDESTVNWVLTSVPSTWVPLPSLSPTPTPTPSISVGITVTPYVTPTPTPPS